MHMKSIIVCVLLFVSIGLSIATHMMIHAKPQREAYVRNSNQKYNKLELRQNPVSTDAKVIEFVIDVVAECFSLTALNATTKSNYCQDTYFGRNAGLVYKHQFADAKAVELSNNDGSYYTVAAKPPIIISTPNIRANRLYYGVYVPLITTTALRIDRPSEQRHMRLWVRPTLNAKNPKMYEIIGVKR